MTTNLSTRPSPIAGTWYPGKPEELRKEVAGFIEEAIPTEIKGKLIGLISPHAGYRYSGPTAGYSYRCVLGMSFDLVVVVSPLHDFLPYPYMTSAHANYATPLGSVPVDQGVLNEFDNQLFKKTESHIVSISNDREHSLEIQLPFLQYALVAPFHLVPLMVREKEEKALQQFGETLAEVLHDKNVLLVASTDLSHFFTEQEAERLDRHMLAQFEAFSPQGVMRAEDEHSGYACGSGAVAAVFWAAQGLGANKVTILHHSTSAAATGDTSQVVGYGAAAISKNP